MIKLVCLSLLVCSAIGLNITIDDCPENLNRDEYLRVFKDNCYSFHLYRLKTFNDAQNHCQRHGGNLVMVKTPEINTFLSNSLTGTYHQKYVTVWIGLEYHMINDKYAWIDGTDLSYSNFVKGVENIVGSCMYLSTIDGKWMKSSCSSKNRFSDPIHEFICQYTPGMITPHPTIQQRFTTENCPPGLKRDKYLSVFEDKCYEVVTKMKTYQQSKNDCEERGGMLALVKSKAINEHIRDEFVETHYKHNAEVWIGLEQEGGNFTWLDGSVMRYKNFYEPPRFFTKACFFLRVLNGAWHITTCDVDPIPGGGNTRFSVCEYPVTNNTPTYITKQTTTTTPYYKTTTPTTKTPTKTTTPTTTTTPATTTKTPATTTTTTTPITTPPTTTTPATTTTPTTMSTPPTKAPTMPSTTACPSIICNLDCGLDGYKMDPVTNCMICECAD